jgi:diguanylate cyclase (GGDEF)-like protein
VAEALRSAREDATTDRLTHVANRPMLIAQLYGEVDRAVRHGRPLAVAFIDLDNFKAVNDTYGHEVGDAVLRDVAGVFADNTRTADFVGRYGGEEFVIVLPDTTAEEASVVAEKIRHLVLRRRFEGPHGEPFTTSISIGITGGCGPTLHVDRLLRDADAAMYAAKSLGRNQTYVFAEVDDDTVRIGRAPISEEGRQKAIEVGDQVRHAAESMLAEILMLMPHYRGQPSSLIAAIAVRMALELGLPDCEVERIRVASLLHDIGKVAVPAQILQKPGPLDDDEWLRVVQHPRTGDAILQRVASVGDARAIILHHHEHYSGRGYPHGLAGNDIPLGARIVAVADAYDAMVQDRPYRSAITHAAAIEELRRCANVQFDPELVDLFCSLYSRVPPIAEPALLIPTRETGLVTGNPHQERAASA